MSCLRAAPVFLLLSACSSSRAKDALPPEIPVESVLGVSYEDGFREGCGAAAFRLPDQVARKIAVEGLAYFPKYRGTDPHGGWRETPGEIEVSLNGHGAKVTFFGLYAMGGCDNQSHPELHDQEIREALSTPGNYYWSGGNLERVIVVAPRRRLVTDYYFG